MLKYYIRIVWRQWRASRVYSLINLGGLTAGLAVSLLIGLWIGDELSFDHYFPDHDRIVKVIVTKPSDAGLITSDLLSQPLIGELRASHSRFFRHLAIVFPNFPHALTAGISRPVPITASGQWAEPEWPQILSLRMLRGSRNALVDPSSVLIDRSTATALFGTTDPMNRDIRVDNSINVKVAGIYDDLPVNSSFAGTHLLLAWKKAADEMPSLKDGERDWSATGFWIFGELNDPKEIHAAGSDISNILRAHIIGSKDELSLYPMDRWHLYSDFQNGKSVSGRIRVVLLFTFIGICVLLLACINFMNLSTARSERRAREVGIRKIFGTRRYQLVAQFLSESLFLTMLALLLAIAISQLSLPFFSRLSGKELCIPYTSPVFWFLTLAFAIFTGLISGSYPALYLARFQPVKVLSGRHGSARNAALARRFLVVLQFSISVSLIIATTIVYRQVAYAKARPVGYNRDGLVAIRMNTSDIYSVSYNRLRNDLLRSGAVINMAQSSNEATERPADMSDISWEGKTPGSSPSMTFIDITHDFGATIQWKMVAGRDFSRAFATDSTAILINEAAAHYLGWKDPIGRSIRFWDSDHRIIGVAGNIVNGSPYQPVNPTIFGLSYHDVNYITVRLNPNMTATTALNTIAKIFKRYDPGASFNPHFLTDDYAVKFAAEEQIGRLSAVLAALAIFISCLGLFGLAAFVAGQRTREIGIRKVLGASATRLISLLSGDFLKLVLIALAIAIPVSAWAMDRWLEDFSYRTPLSPWVFAGAGVAAITVALLAVSTQALRAALANPVDSLRAG